MDLVFSGAGNKICLHLGALKAYNEIVGDFDQVAGTSAGSIIAAMLALGYKYDFIERAILNVDFSWITYQTKCFFLEFIYFLQNGFLAGHRRFRKVLKKYLQNVKFRDLNKNLYIYAYNVSSNWLRLFSKQETPDVYIIDAVLASCSLPILFRPYELYGELYIDGGIAKNFPVDLYELGDNIFGHLVIETLNHNFDDSRKNPKLSFNKFSYRDIRHYNFYSLIEQLLSSNSIVSINDCLEMGKYLVVANSYYDIGMFDFNITDKQKQEMIDVGYRSAKLAF